MLKLRLSNKTYRLRDLMLFAIIFCGLIATTQAQFEDPRVSLIEDKRDKRTVLYLQNNTDQNLNVFLKVDGTGYRKSSDRPVIKDIPAREKVHMITLIPLRDEPSSYTHIIVVNEEAKDINVSHRPDEPNLRDFELLLDNDLVVFTQNSCQPCDKLISKLQNAHVPHKVINIDDRRRYYTALQVFLNENDDDSYKIAMPVVKKYDKLIHPIISITKTATLLIEEFGPKKDSRD